MESNRVDAVTDLGAVLTTAHVPEIRMMLAEIRPELSQDSLTFRAAVLLLTGPAAAFNIDRLACRTQMPRSVVAACARRLFDNGVWHPDGPVYAWQAPDDPKFWSDVAVAEGQLCRRLDRLGRIEWASAGAWRKAYDFGTRNQVSLSVEYSSFVDSDTLSGLPDHARLPSAGKNGEDAAPGTPANEKVDRSGTRMPARTATPETGAPWIESESSEPLFPGTVWLT
jgi:hypothetical protein